jgi:hypothetical protein
MIGFRLRTLPSASRLNWLPSFRISAKLADGGASPDGRL